MNRQQVSNWFEAYETLATDLGIIDVPSHIWNTDETGCQNIHTANDSWCCREAKLQLDGIGKRRNVDSTCYGRPM